MDIGRGIRRYLAGRRAEHRGEPVRGADPPVARTGGENGSGTSSMLLEHAPGPSSTAGEEERMGQMDEERMQILRMVEEHKVSAEEAARLLAALDSQPGRSAEPQTETRARWLRVRVTDSATGRSKVNVNVPVSAVLALGKLGNRLGGSFLEKEGIDLEALIESIRSGAEGKIVDVSDENSRDHVEVYVE